MIIESPSFSLLSEGGYKEKNMLALVQDSLFSRGHIVFVAHIKWRLKKVVDKDKTINHEGKCEGYTTSPRKNASYMMMIILVDYTVFTTGQL